MPEPVDATHCACDDLISFSITTARKTPAVRRWLIRRPRYHVHFTPTGASWFNLVERWFSALAEKQLRRGVHRNAREVEVTIKAYLATNNEQSKPFVWTKTSDEILATIARFCHQNL